ncbi:MAG: T9SS type A sorting domain-containing protein [Bacteroidetes bacterium]|uniref:T9SS type A sorting domain-containing protein n=1 Tax=Candidatus Pullibacteroides excrementavium TaxID=2840905 RepID=A0A9D9DTV5_9BACT|nr:T9SS type A sorting domain-containing protein [Candidatus Pullibacteroides excrementavium]
MKNLMDFKVAALGLLLGCLPMAGWSQSAAGDAGLGAKAITNFKATVEVDKGMVLTRPGSGFDTLAVDIAFSGTFDTTDANEFVVLLSDPQGSFMQNTTEVIRLAEAEDTVYNWVVPTTVADGDLYRVGVRSTLLDSVVGQSLQFRIKYEYKAEPQIPNSGFEVWMNEGEEVAEPVGWHSFQTATGEAYRLAEMFGALAPIRQSDDVRPGSDGRKSVQVISKFAVLAAANGNLTTGMINMGSPTASDITKNYNFSNMEDPAYALPFTTVPDSLTFWVKFAPTDALIDNSSVADAKAAVTVAIHDDFRYQDPNSADSIESHMVAKAQQLFSDSKGEWVRYSVPFTAGQSVDPRYLLVSVATNINPGVGPGANATSSDTVWLDDILMIYNPEVSLSLGANQLWDGVDSVSFNAVLEGTFNPSNVNGAEENLLIVEADTLQDFSSGSVLVLYSQAQEAGTVEGNLDVRELKAGKTYYLRARTTNYADTSAVSVLHMLEYRSEYAVSYSIEGSDAATVQVFRNEETESLKASDTVSVYDSLTFIVSYPEDEKLLGWYENGALLASTDTVVVDSVMRDYALTARLAPRYYSLEISGVSEQDGSVLVCYAGSGDTVADLDRIEVPADLTLTAIPAQYRLLEGFYTADSVLIGRTSPLSFSMTGDTAIQVRFARQTGKLAIELEGIDYVEKYVVTYAESGDTLKDLNAIELPAELSLSASVLPGGEFVGLYTQGGTEEGELLSQTLPFAFTLQGDTAFVLVFGKESAIEGMDAFQVRVYPNPVKEELHVEGADLDRIEVFSLTGAKMLEAELEGNTDSIRLASLMEGMYIYKVYDRSGAVSTGRILKM